jgi:SAM-dependent methyltransferase
MFLYTSSPDRDDDGLVRLSDCMNPSIRRPVSSGVPRRDREAASVRDRLCGLGTTCSSQVGSGNNGDSLSEEAGEKLMPDEEEGNSLIKGVKRAVVLTSRSQISPIMRAKIDHVCESVARLSRSELLLLKNLQDEFEGKLTQKQLIDIVEATKYLKMGGRISHQGALIALTKAGVLASQRYDDIHLANNHSFSTISEHPSHLFDIIAHNLEDKGLGIGPGSTVLDLGSGPGDNTIRCAKLGARVVAVDASSVATDNLRKHLKGKDYANRVHVENMDFRDYLRNPSIPFTHIISVSSLHYFPPEYLVEEILPYISKCLISGGCFCLAMKTSKSDSAQEYNHDGSMRQFRLTSKDGFNVSIDTEDVCVRMYPDSDKIDEIVGRAVGRGRLAILNNMSVPVLGYDKTEETESLRIIISQTPVSPPSSK